ncbi:hypothetical protein NMY22_g9755 [Coprinellus aureogranulatus]|nr:hypothetical protein NMY22_g9755 [Coprinellus aureogranulatus]
MPSSIHQWVVDVVFPGLSTVSPQLLRLHSKRRWTSASSSDYPNTPLDPPTLPCEVLQNIFALAMQQSRPDIDYKEQANLRSTILACAQVCWLWREAARGYSPLWVHAIDFQAHPPQVIHDLLQLSRPHPIEVGHRSAPFRITRGRDFVVLNLLKEDCPRIREWNIEIPEAYSPLNYCRWIFGVAGATDPRTVHTLRLSGSIVSPTGALQGLTPSLRKLCLRETNLNLSPYMDFTRLTELSVSSSTSPSVKYRLMKWLALLRRMPRLQFLSLKDAIKPGPEMDPIAANQPVQTVSLRQLKVLSLAESTWESAYPILALLRGPTLQKPRDCGLILSLPSTSCLPAPGISLLEVTFALGLASLSQVPQGMQTSTLTCPRLEMSLSAIRSGFDFTLGTVQDHERTLDWNGDMGTQGVNEYLNRYSKTASTSHLTAVCTFLHPLVLQCQETCRTHG